MSIFKRLLCLILTAYFLAEPVQTIFAAENDLKRVSISMKCNVTDRDELWGYYGDNIFYVSLEDLCEISEYHLLEETEEIITLGNGTGFDNSTRVFRIYPDSDKMKDSLFSESHITEMPAVQIGDERYISVFHFLKYIGVSYILNPDSNPQLMYVKRYDIHDALVDSLSSWNYFSWDEIYFTDGSLEENLTWAGVIALISKGNSPFRLMLDAKGIYRENLEDNLLTIVANEGAEWLNEEQLSSEMLGLVNDSYGVSFDWFDFIKQIYNSESGSTLNDVFQAISETGNFIKIGGTFLESNAEAVETVIQYGNLTDVQKTLLQDTLISHADDSDLLAEDDFWDIISEAAENVDARVQKEMKAQSEASIKAVTDIALEVNNAVNGDFTGNNPVMLVWDCMMWTMNFMPEGEQASMFHDAYNCSMIQQAANQLFVSAYSDLYYHNFYYNDIQEQEKKLAYLKAALILQLKATLTTREYIINSGLVEDSQGLEELKSKSKEVAVLLNQTENSMVNGPGMYPSEYKDDISWIEDCEVEPGEIYEHAVEKLNGASFDVLKEGVLHVNLEKHEDVRHTQNMNVGSFATEKMTGSGSYMEKGGISSDPEEFGVVPEDAEYEFIYSYPDMIRTYKKPEEYQISVKDQLLTLTLPPKTCLTKSSAEIMQDGSTLVTLEYDGTGMTKNNVGILDVVLPSSYGLYWPSGGYDQDWNGVDNAVIQAKIDNNYNLMEVDVDYTFKGIVIEYVLLEGKTTFKFTDTVFQGNEQEKTKKEKADVAGVWLEQDSDDPIVLTFKEDGSFEYYASVSHANDYYSQYSVEEDRLTLNLPAPDNSCVVPVPYIVSSLDSERISLKIDFENITVDTSPLCGVEESLEGEYKRLSLTDAQLETARQRLNVPADIEVQFRQGTPQYWDAGERWLVYVGVYDDDSFLAGASFDPFEMEMYTDVYMYSE